MTDVGCHHGTMVATGGTAHGTIRGTVLGMTLGMIHGIMVAIMAGRHHGVMAGTAIITIVHGATMAGILLFIIMVDAAIDRQLMIASTPIVM